MGKNEDETRKPDESAPRRFRPSDLKERYLITERLAGDWLRAMVAAGVIRKLRGVKVGRWSAIDAWVEGGGVVPARGRKAAAK